VDNLCVPLEGNPPSGSESLVLGLVPDPGSRIFSLEGTERLLRGKIRLLKKTMPNVVIKKIGL
jgi:hypothetical protein